ncbi:hypothetical protein RJT34_11702 [Clitoria ternatea]|uniref:Secretory carrier-associated membrane protein n=1 Tax=Clitoria ternatea TaxID=43366 RepID=A0AAN9JMC4_CLITE
MWHPVSVPPATNSRLPPLKPELVDYNYGFGATVDIPLDTSADLKKKEKELQSKEAELKRREQVYKYFLVSLCQMRVPLLFTEIGTLPSSVSNLFL